MFSTLKDPRQIEKIHGCMKNVGCRILLSHIQAFAAPTKNKDTDKPTWAYMHILRHGDTKYVYAQHGHPVTFSSL